MSTTHTPGPWAIVADVPGHEIGYRAIVAVEDGELAETICNPSPMGGANAALIAAAPELLAALEAADKWVAMYHDQPGHDAASRCMSAVIRAAIAKATGA